MDNIIPAPSEENLKMNIVPSSSELNLDTSIKGIIEKKDEDVLFGLTLKQVIEYLFLIFLIFVVLLTFSLIIPS